MTVELTDRKYAELGQYKHDAIKARSKLERLIKKIENMQYDCDGEIYDQLIEIQEMLAR